MHSALKPGSVVAGVVTLIVQLLSPCGRNAQYWCIAQCQHEAGPQNGQIIVFNQYHRFILSPSYVIDAMQHSRYNPRLADGHGVLWSYTSSGASRQSPSRDI